MSFNVFSIGPGNLSKEEFLKRLRERGIAVLVDLRAHPYSTYAPQFDRENLERDLSRLNVKYLYFGNKLGGRPPEGFETFRRNDLLPRLKSGVSYAASVF